MKYSVATLVVTVLCLVVQCSGFVRQFPDSFYSSDSDLNFFPWLEYSEDEVSSQDVTPEGVVSSDQQQERNVQAQDIPDLPGLDGNRTYMDLFLCGQFMDLDEGSDYAVVTFDYAGYEVKFDPCDAVANATRPINFIYMSGEASASADLKVSQALPTMWRRYSQSIDGGQSPRNVHFFSRNLPGKAAIKKLVNFVQHDDRTSVSFFLAYLVEQSAEVRDFFKHIQPLLDNGINVMKVCGRCNYLSNMPKTSGYRMISRYGMARPNMYVRDGCPLIDPLQVPGEIYNGLSCDTFQGSLMKCASEFITKNCQLSRFGVSLSDVTHTQGMLSRVVYNVTKTCLKSVSCWKETSSQNMEIFEELIPVVCSFTTQRAKTEVTRCVKASSHLPFDPNSPHSAAAKINFVVTYAALFIIAIRMLAY